MKTNSFFINIVYIFLLISGSVYGLGEKTISLGGEATWNVFEFRDRVTEFKSVRPFPVLLLSSAADTTAGSYLAATGLSGNFTALKHSAIDLDLTFDERDASLFRDSAGKYKVTVSPELKRTDRSFARAGTGAALFGGLSDNLSDNLQANENKKLTKEQKNRPLTIEPRNADALFAPKNRIGDFTIEFWIHPLNMENGEQILSWASTIPAKNSYIFQNIKCSATKNRLQWSFENFFTSPNGASHININFSGNSAIIPKAWSHHLVRFDMATGLIEYLVNGKSETIMYATQTGREGGNIYTPVIGEGGLFSIGESYIGLMDEFKIHNAFINRSSIQRFIPKGGRTETRAIDLGGNNSSVLKVEASGGNARIKGTKINSEFIEKGRFKFADDSEMQFFIRACDNPWHLNNREWVSFIPGETITSHVRGRYAQIAVDFYPSADGEASPYLNDLRIIYLPGEPPLPPGNLTAIAADSGVQLRWKNSPDANTDGYLVYYSSVRGELFGNDAALGPSPIDAGKKNSITIDGLNNGTLYYFRVAAYDRTAESAYNAGEFSREVTARPLTGLSFQTLEAR